jgi:ribosomal protein S18 acetylase RimI-like enzyme
VRNKVSQYLHDTRQFNFNQALHWYRMSDTKYWVVITDGENLGYFRIKAGQSPDFSYIGMDLDVPYQGKKLAPKLYRKFVEDVLVPQGVEHLLLRVKKSNKRALRLYEGLGFSIVETTELDFLMSVPISVLMDKTVQYSSAN